MLLEYTNLYPERTGAMNYGPSHIAVSRAYHEALAEAFRIAVNDPQVGDDVTRRARAGLVGDVLLPFDAQFGQVKEDKSGIHSFTAVAQRAVLGFELPELQLALAKRWRLPAQLVAMMHHDASAGPRGRCVALAVNPAASATTRAARWCSPR